MHVWLKKMIGEKRNGKVREEERKRGKDGQSQFHYLV